jgi:hypothetical protein
VADCERPCGPWRWRTAAKTLSMSSSDFTVMDAATGALVLLLNSGRAASAMASGLVESNFNRDGLVCGGGLSGRAAVLHQFWLSSNHFASLLCVACWRGF